MPEFEFEGLDIGGNDSATDEAFAEAFRRADGVTPEEPSDEATPDEESAAEAADDEGQPRDEQGRFARTQPEVTDLEEQQAEHEQELEPEQEEDPEVAAFLAKYGNDPEKALRAAVELSKLQGRQGDELGQLRQQLQELQQRVEQPQQRTPITEAFIEDLDALAMENPHAALARVGQVGDPTGQLTDRVMDIWFATNPRQASAFQAAAIAQQTEQRVRAELEPIVEERGHSAEERAYVDSWNLALSKHPDMNDHAQAMHDLLQERPALARAVLASESVEERAQAFETVYELVAGRAPAPTPEVTQIAERQQREQAKAARARAAVAKPSAVVATPGADEREVTEEDRIKSGILEAKNTDILSGFTFE